MWLSILACTAQPEDSGAAMQETDAVGDTGWSCDGATFNGEDVGEAMRSGEVLLLDEPGTLTLCPGTWFAQLVVTADVLIEGGGPENTILSGGETFTPIVIQDAQVTVRNLTLDRGAARSEEGNAGSGGALRCVEGGQVLMENLHLTNNTAYDGGGAYARDGCTLTVEQCRFTDNRSVDDGGALRVNFGEATIRDSTFTRNVARDGGALIFHESAVLIERSTFTDNTSTDTQGGAVLHYFAPLTIRRSHFEGNQSLSFGGALGLFGDTTLEDVSVEGNASTSGGGLVLYPPNTLSCTDCRFADNDPDDVQLYEGEAYAISGTFSCTQDGCG